MNAYQYDSFGFYVGDTTADESPLEPGIYLLPGNCTFTSPPEQILKGTWPKWNGSSWDCVEIPKPPEKEKELNQEYITPTDLIQTLDYKDPVHDNQEPVSPGLEIDNVSPIEKLKIFLTSNPDVAALLNTSP